MLRPAHAVRAPHPVPALAPETAYLSRLSARSALYTELRLLLDAHRRAPHRSFRALVLDENCLARRTAAARAKVWEEIHKRYRLDPAEPLFAAFLLEWERCSFEQERGLTAYVLLALNDRLVADLGQELLWPLLGRAPAALDPADVLSFLQRAARAHPEVDRWTPSTRLALAQKYCASVRDFGLARGTMKKATVRPALHGAPMRLLIRALRLAGTPILDIVRSPLFRLVGIAEGEVIDALGDLNRIGALRFRMQGDIVELDLDLQFQGLQNLPGDDRGSALQRPV